MASRPFGAPLTTVPAVWQMAARNANRSRPIQPSAPTRVHIPLDSAPAETHDAGMEAGNTADTPMRVEPRGD